MAPLSPVVARWDLGRRLREQRELLGLTGTAAGKLIKLSATFLSDVENGKKNLPEDKLDALIAAYEFDSGAAAELRALREQCSQRGWWSKFNTLFSPDVLRFYGYEYGAETTLTFFGDLIPGLLQTRDYARAVIETGSPWIRLAEADLRVEARMIRQRRLTGDEPLRLTAVMSEAALRQQVGGPAVLVGQLRHLVTMVEQHPDTVQVLVVPFSSPGYPALGGKYQILTFAGPTLPPLAWLDNITSTELIDDAIKVKEWGLAHTGTVDVALDRQDTLDLIKQVTKEIS
ncbi:MAG: helix-turn-helix domain-containing protein [Pseudonocardiaceae bacterium]